MTGKNIFDNMIEKILNLNLTVWENRLERENITEWLNNYNNDNERIHALFLLSQFMYFGSDQMRYLMRCVYRDLFKYPKIRMIREMNNDTTDMNLISKIYEEDMKNTRFLGVGNPSESGVHLLYFFRQENRLSKTLFINTHEIFNRYGSHDTLELKNENVCQYVFIDDFCGSGKQAKLYSKHILEDLKRLNNVVRVDYLTLFAMREGLDVVRCETEFDRVEAVIELDASFKCFSESSRYFVKEPESISKNFAEEMCRTHGKVLMYSICKNDGIVEPLLTKCSEDNSLGFSDSQLLIGFYHNTPDNTLPIIWYDEKDILWIPIFKRYNKKYGT